MTAFRHAALSLVALGWTSFALPGLAAAKQAQPRATIAYTVKKGDTLFDLASRFLVGANAGAIVQRFNHIADPRRMPVGLRLYIPVRLVRQEPIRAAIVSFSGTVAITVAGQTLAAAQGAAVGEGSDIQTGANAFVSLKLPDGTIVTMPSQTRVRIGLLRLTPLTGGIDRRFDVASGRVRAVVVPMTNPRSTFKVGTPVAVSAVRGTEFRVGYDPAIGRAVTEVIAGKVAVAAPRTPGIMVPAGYGAAARSGAGPSAPQPLLPAPALVGGASMQRNPILAFAARAVDGAVGYRLQIARDAGFLDQIGEVDSAGPSFTFQPLPDGTYFARIAGLDVIGLEGRSDVFGFQRRLHSVTASMDSSVRGDRRDYLFRWEGQGAGTYVYRFQLARCGSDQPPIVDQANIANFSLTVSDLPNGTYCWRVQSVEVGVGVEAGDVVWSEAKTFTIAQ